MEDPRITPYSVLLIEDNLDDAQLIQRMLNKEYPDSFQFTNTTSIASAADALSNEKFDVVVTDLELPDSSEMETIKKILNISPQLPVIVLTANDNQDLAVEIVKYGAQDYLVKGQGDGHLISRSIRYSIERKRLQQEIINASMIDTLTGLTKRGMFYDHLKKILKRAVRNNTRFAVLFIDLDRFKHINDAYGHLVGDIVLKEISNRMVGCIRASDLVARFAGDEFTIIVEDIKDDNSVISILDKLHDSCNTPIKVGFKDNVGLQKSEDISINLSIGIAIYPDDNIYHDELMMHADMAMYEAKRRGSNQYVFFSEIRDKLPKR